MRYKLAIEPEAIRLFYERLANSRDMYAEKLFSKPYDRLKQNQRIWVNETIEGND